MTNALTTKQARVGPRPRPDLPLAYTKSAELPPVDLWLAGNEGRPPTAAAPAADTAPPERYPDASGLEADIAERFGLAAEQVIVTAGADDALLRVSLAYLGPGRTAVLPEPTFTMIERYVRISGAEVRRIRWDAGTPYPTARIASSGSADVVFVVSPNNPTGDIATVEDVEALTAKFPSALIVVDAAYAEFDTEDLTRFALGRPNCVVLRTFSKAFGAASLRVGYALGAPEAIDALRAAGNPYPCAGPSLSRARALLRAPIAPFVDRVREERAELTRVFKELGLDAAPSRGNFVYARTPRARTLAELIAGLGIAVRAFDAPEAALRVTCPGDPDDFSRLISVLRAACAPEAILFDMDGVLADVSSSYRSAIRRTARSFGVRVEDADIDTAKATGDANDDWALTQRMLSERGVDAELAEVTQRFERFYQGADGRPGLWRTERLLVPREELEALGQRFRLGIVTGRPRSDARAFLTRFGIADLFDAVVCREDAPLKPDPAPTERALAELGVTSAWLVGDTPDDVRSARRAGVVPIAVDAGLGPQVLRTSGAGVVLPSTRDLLEILP